MIHLIVIFIIRRRSTCSSLLRNSQSCWGTASGSPTCRWCCSAMRCLGPPSLGRKGAVAMATSCLAERAVRGSCCFGTISAMMSPSARWLDCVPMSSLSAATYVNAFRQSCDSASMQLAADTWWALPPSDIQLLASEHELGRQFLELGLKLKTGFLGKLPWLLRWLGAPLDVTSAPHSSILCGPVGSFSFRGSRG